MLQSVALVTLLATGLASGLGLAGAVEDKYSCPHGWTRYGTKKCLKYINELQDYERAQTTCRSKNQGSLVSIHSHEEQNFVYSYIHSIAASSTPVWLGAKQIDFESILWLDKTENSYTNWAPSEPSHPDEICIAINPRNGMWHDVMCTEANVPACERAPTTQWPFFVAFCSEGWFQFNDEKCVRIISSQALNFYESQELCRSKYNSKLLSIKTDRESEFLHNLIKFRDVKLPVWLGAVQNDFSSFNWIDKSDVTFTNWAEGEPNDPDHACLSMTASGGKWSDNDCKEQKLILCQKVPEDSSCETGWLQFRQDKCYRFVHIRLAFDDAESLCNNLYAGHLPSIHSQEEQFMISQFLASVNVKNGSEIWLGGRQMDFHNFNWGDGSLFNYSYWEHGEPNFPAEKCIEMSWRNGRWNDISCRLKRAVLCERQVTSRHTPMGSQLPPASTSKPPPLYNSNCLAGERSANCTGNNDGPQSAPTNALGQPQLLGALDLFLDPSHQPAGPTVAAAQPAAAAPETNSSISGESSLVNRSLAAAAERPSGELDDPMPIKMIASIIHREQPAPETAAYLPLPSSPTVASSSSGSSSSSSTTASTTASSGASASTSSPVASTSSDEPTTSGHHQQAALVKSVQVTAAAPEPAPLEQAQGPRRAGELGSELANMEPRAAAAATAAATQQPQPQPQPQQSPTSPTTSLLLEKLQSKPQQQATADTAEMVSQTMANLTYPAEQQRQQLSPPDISSGTKPATAPAALVLANQQQTTAAVTLQEVPPPPTTTKT